MTIFVGDRWGSRGKYSAHNPSATGTKLLMKSREFVSLRSERQDVWVLTPMGGVQLACARARKRFAAACRQPVGGPGYLRRLSRGRGGVTRGWRSRPTLERAPRGFPPE